MKTFLLFPFLLSAILCLAQSAEELPKKFVLPPDLQEVSGLYRASLDSLWWHNDSGDQPRLFVTDRCGYIKHVVHLPQLHSRDWEDITADDSGNIYIGDFGNNSNSRKDLRIYIYNPQEQTLDSILFSYPDQTQFPPPREHANFDMEAFFWHQDSLHLFSKNRLNVGNFYTKHYVLSAQPGEQEVFLQDSINLKNRVVTAAAISPDGQTVALLAYNFKRVLGFIPVSAASVFTFQNFRGTDFFKGKFNRQKIPAFLLATQYESLDFVNADTIYVASEQTVFIKPKAKLMQLKLKKGA